MKILYICLLLFTVGYCLQYKVVAPATTTMKVNVGGTEYDMQRKWPEVPYYTVKVDSATTDQTYKYVADGTQSEVFDRVWPACKPSSTYNDFFGREETIKKLDQLGWPFQEKQQWERNLGPRGVFNDDYISTVIFVGPTVNDFFMTVANKTKVEGLSAAMINRDTEEFWNNTIEMNIEDTSQLKPKMKVDLPSNYRSRSSYKLRPSSGDPVFIRDKLYNDVLEAVGCPHGEASFARVYVNSLGLGLYHLQESPSSKDFIKTQFFGADNMTKPDPLGVYLDATTGADFATDANIAAFEPPKNQSNQIITTLIQALADLDITNDAAVAEFDRSWFSIDHFFRAIALEYLSGDYDSYWFMTTNYVVYNDPTESTSTTNKFYFIDQDFDQTYGINLAPIYNPYGANYTSQPYTVYVNKTWSVVSYDAPHRTMVDRLLSNPTYKNKFEETLKTIVQGVWNPIALERRIESIVNRIRPDIEWDYTLGTNRAHLGNDVDYRIIWTLEDFNTGFNTSLRGNWGLYNFITERADYVSQSFGISYTNPPLSPPATNCTVGDNDPDTDTTTGTIELTTSSVPLTSSGSSSTSGNSGSVTGTVNPEDSSASSFSYSLFFVIATMVIFM